MMTWHRIAAALLVVSSAWAGPAYRPKGCNAWDFWFAKDGDTYHAFYLEYPDKEAMPDQSRRHGGQWVGHAVSKDLVHWEERSTALKEAPARGIATGSCVRDGERWRMLLTYQGFTLAESTDLEKWKWVGKASFPSELEAEWKGETLRFRLLADPYVYPEKIDGWWYAAINAQIDGVPKEQSGAQVLMRSRDLLQWESHKIISWPKLFERMETAQFWEKNGKWYLHFGGAGGKGGSHIYIASRFDGPYEERPWSEMKLPGIWFYLGKRVVAPDGCDVFLAGQDYSGLSVPYRMTYAPDGTICFALPMVFAQAKPEVANAKKDAKRAWEIASAEKKALWQQQREALKHIDLSDDTQRQIVIARGSPEPGAYHAHPTTALLADNRTMFCVWNIGHGGHAGPMARSDDAGLTWTRLDDALPPNYANFKNCPSIYRLADPQGKERLWVFAARTLTEKENPTPIAGRHEGFMPRIVSEDGGKTWRELPPVGGRISKDDPFRCIMTFSSMVRLKDGSTLGLFHRGGGIGEDGTLQVLQSVTRDGGFTWAQPVMACDGTALDGKDPCEPYVFRSPDGEELCCLMRENRRSGTSLVMFSRDEGKTWSKAVDAPWGLTGDRHHGICLPDGRLVIVFRNASPNAKDKGGFIAWVGTYDDIRQGKPGQYRVSLLKTFKDGFYPGLHLLPDGTIVATTYANFRKEDIGCSIISIRFKMSEIDALATKTSSGVQP